MSVNCENVGVYTSTDSANSWRSPLEAYNKPHLRMVEGPETSFRFRYASEQKSGSHGKLCGATTQPNSRRADKTFPTIELMNYKGQAVIKVRLDEDCCDRRHPADEQLSPQQARRKRVPHKESYAASFDNISINLVSKEECLNWLAKDTGKPRTECAHLAKMINLRAVRLRFSAHQPNGVEICPPLYSQPIIDSRCQTELKIVDHSLYRGQPQGGDEMWIAVEGVKKKNDIEVVFFDDTPEGKIEFATIKHPAARFHTLSTIKISTPKYTKLDIKRNKRVYFELHRPTDGLRSEPKSFEYKPHIGVTLKRKRYNSSCDTSMTWSSASSSSAHQPPVVTVELSDDDDSDGGYYFSSGLDMFTQNILNTHVPIEETSPQSSLETATQLSSVEMTINSNPLSSTDDPILGQANSIQYPANFTGYPVNNYGYSYNPVWDSSPSNEDPLVEVSNDSGICNPNFIIFNLEDSQFPLSSDCPKTNSTRTTSETEMVDTQVKPKMKEFREFSIVGNQIIKKVVTQICELVAQGIKANSVEIANKLEDVLAIRCPNGDTFLHTTLLQCNTSFYKLVHLIHSIRLPHLLNLTNSLGQTILHLAVANDLPTTVPMLVSKGCCPLAADHEGNTPLHYAVICCGCLGPLLSAALQLTPPVDIDIYNNAKQSPLHWAAMRNCVDSARALLSAGARCTARDARGCTPLHYAAEYDSADFAEVITQFTSPDYMDLEDGRGYTALLIACERNRRSSLKIAKILLQKQTRPLKREYFAQALKLARDNPDMRQLLSAYVPLADLSPECSEHSHSESEQEFQSAEEGDDIEIVTTLAHPLDIIKVRSD